MSTVCIECAIDDGCNACATAAAAAIAEVGSGNVGGRDDDSSDLVFVMGTGATTGAAVSEKIFLDGDDASSGSTAAGICIISVLGDIPTAPFSSFSISSSVSLS